ncbi:uncharacterized protein LOC127797260 isoform X4 [Diospyros lotus]|uniref:uncharacterized protein LOC127797260 isoform X1 n=1 Tax=Diospyros lotus TaxID=55363 RepID=UPI00224E8BE1|nr:uncharacterized protein LOC127797260 isoform X1 [Diospyros lotus]XP_052185949.1 uncharacterized protein LOC127797260 isoform X2 [Diospyros lotus]XP_052185950.1 uncharacterized protein LOC127797260 isoform X3 [Diospyros lotus]XP_052185951.1 uncharacterized protein LOC127797260 isoform X4 [Diospyros lotus]
MDKTASLKLLVDTTTDKVVFAEAGKDFVDFLFGLLQLPLGGILAALPGQAVSGSIIKIYESAQNLADEYLQPSQTKNSLLRPATATSNTEPSPLLKALPFSFQGSSSSYSSYDRPNVVQGYVKSAVVYTVADDLTVKPLSTVSSLALLNSLKVKDIGVLQEKIVVVGMDEGLKLLKASLESTTVLTDVFLR